MQKEAIRQGFTPESARQLVQQAALGAAALVEASPDTPLATLRENVTSKGGTTAEALRVFNERQLTQNRRRCHAGYRASRAGNGKTVLTHRYSLYS